jgi:hypothetical protein
MQVPTKAPPGLFSPLRSAAVPLAIIAAILTSTFAAPPRSLLPMLAAIGLVDTGANVLVATATTQGAAGIVAVLARCIRS